MPSLLNSKQSLETQLIELELEELHREELKRGLVEEEVKPIWKPNPGPQTMAFESLADELFYGGAAGGGKTDLALGLAALNHRMSIIFRRVFPSMRGMIQRSREIYNSQNTDRQKDSYNETLHIWRLADGRIIEFGSIQHLKNVENYRGRPHDLYIFDEVPEFLQFMYQFPIAWNRTTILGQRCRVVVTGNPPNTPEGQWVIEYWGPWLDPHHPNPAEPGELRWFVTLDGESKEVDGPEPFYHKDELVIPRSRTFIPALLSDNPYQDGTSYRSVLQSLPEPLRSQMLYGDFNASANEDPWQVIPTEWVRLAQQRWLNHQADLERDGGELPQQTTLGVDVARGGKDFTVIVERRGNWVGEPLKIPGKDTPESDPVVREIIKVQQDTCQWVNIDVIGPGGAVLDTGNKMGLAGLQGVNVAKRSIATDKTGKLTFVNLRAELYWVLREALDPESGDNIMLPPHKEVLPDLCSAKWMMRVNGIQVEAKEDIKKRIGRSPDVGDAVLLACWINQDLGELSAGSLAIFGVSSGR